VLEIVRESRDKAGHDGTKELHLVVHYIHCQSTHVLSILDLLIESYMQKLNLDGLGKSRGVFAGFYLSQLTIRVSSWLLSSDSKFAQS